MQPVVELKDVDVAFGSIHVLEDITLTVEEKDFLGLLGPNGAGKTTLLKVVAGLLRPYHGTVKLFGEDIAKSTLRSKIMIGYVPQRITLQSQNFPTTVYEIVATGRISRENTFKRLTEEDHQKIEDALRFVGLYELKSRMAGELSGGQLQRIFIARALAGEPSLLIMDEPTSGIDIGSQVAFHSLLDRLNKEQGLTIMMTSHDIGAMSHMCTKVACVNKKLFFHGLTEDLFRGDILSKVYGYHVHPIFHEEHLM
ncbi:MAG: metal ABC transporter ATP-binding protein [Thaumarchaeota archaeon]|nr:metal ABC transporter ATP-binding protein [Nitrososphaerota archaeon]